MFLRNIQSALRQLTRQRVWWFLHRVFWASLMLVHFSALRVVDLLVSGVGPETKEQSALQAIALVAAAWFCLLKTIDIPWLRGNPGWRPKIAATIIVALLHVSVIERATGQDSAFSPAHLGVFLIAVTVANGRVVADWMRRAARRAGSTSHVPTRPLPQPEPFGLAAAAAFEPLRLYLRAGPLGLRAPPLA